MNEEELLDLDLSKIKDNDHFQNVLKTLREESFDHGFETGKYQGYDSGNFEGKRDFENQIFDILKDYSIYFIRNNPESETLVKSLIDGLLKNIKDIFASNFKPSIIENFLSEKDRARLIEIINESESSGIMHPADEITRGNDGRIMLWDEENLEFFNIVKKYLKRVADFYDKGLYPHNIAMLKYYPGPGMPLHTDSAGVCRDTCTVTSVIYLNDDYTGGEVGFSLTDKKYKVSAGSIMHFPQRGFQAYHSVGEILSGNRYGIITCYTDDMSVVREFYKNFYDD